VSIIGGHQAIVKAEKNLCIPEFSFFDAAAALLGWHRAEGAPVLVFGTRPRALYSLAICDHDLLDAADSWPFLTGMKVTVIASPGLNDCVLQPGLTMSDGFGWPRSANVRRFVPCPVLASNLEKQ